MTYLTGDEISGMTMDEIGAAEARGEVDPSASVWCQTDHHAPKCKGRVIGEDWTTTPCECLCHSATVAESGR